MCGDCGSILISITNIFSTYLTHRVFKALLVSNDSRQLMSKGFRMESEAQKICKVLRGKSQGKSKLASRKSERVHITLFYFLLFITMHQIFLFPIKKKASSITFISETNHSVSRSISFIAYFSIKMIPKVANSNFKFQFKGTIIMTL